MDKVEPEPKSPVRRNKKVEQPLKDIELRIVAELMKNCRRSDRELARAIGISQPTVTRIKSKLEKRGVIKEYTIIPDFAQLGYEIMASTRFDVRKGSFEKEFTISEDMAKKYGGITAVEGVSSNRNRLFVNFYRNYADYMKVVTYLRGIPSIAANDFDSFLVVVDNPGYRILSMSAIADQLLACADLEKKKKS
jgi:DNA-binding Lrp family transcriptional regulator